MQKIKVKNKNNIYLIDEKSYQSLNSKGFGYKKENIFYLDIYETIYLLEKKKIEVEKYNNEEIKITKEKIIKNNKFNLNEYIVYKDLKSKGYNIKSGLKFGFSFRIYNKGIKPGEDHSLWLIEVLSEKNKLNIKDLTGKNRIAHSTNKKMLIAIIDDELDVTYIENSWKRL